MAAKACEPASISSQSRVTTSRPAAFKAASTADSISGSPLVRMRPTTPAGDGDGMKPGSSNCMPDVSPDTDAAIGPMVSRPGANGQTPATGTRPWVVFSPYVPQHADGTRTEPPVSEPNAMSASSLATATADPLDEPPGISSGSSGFTGVPYQGLEPIGSMASSWRLALPTIRVPAARAPARQAASAVAGDAVSARAFDPHVVGTPSTSMMSFTASRAPDPAASS